MEMLKMLKSQGESLGEGPGPSNFALQLEHV